MRDARTIAYFLRIDEYLSKEHNIRYDVLRQYIGDDGIVDDEGVYENCTAESGAALLAKLYAEQPPTF